jgi:hypothetical protein
MLQAAFGQADLGEQLVAALVAGAQALEVVAIGEPFAFETLVEVGNIERDGSLRGPDA